MVRYALHATLPNEILKIENVFIVNKLDKIDGYLKKVIENGPQHQRKDGEIKIKKNLGICIIEGDITFL